MLLSRQLVPPKLDEGGSLGDGGCTRPNRASELAAYSYETKPENRGRRGGAGEPPPDAARGKGRNPIYVHGSVHTSLVTPIQPVMKGFSL